MQGGGDDRTYNAFVSYSHADRALGAKLFRRLDAYRTPKRLAGADAVFGPVPEKLYPCFRDREELKAARDLRTILDNALQRSNHLVVLCSPAAARSRWVDHEIRSFSELGKSDRIHAVIAEGEPDEVMPPALRDVGLTTVLAADLRAAGDGFEVGTLKVIAAILGVEYWQLRDRENARKRARRTVQLSILGGASALVLGACSATWYAVGTNEKLQQWIVSNLENVAARVDTAVAQQGVTLTTREVQREIDAARRSTDMVFDLAPDTPLLLLEQARLSMLYARHMLSIAHDIDAISETDRGLDSLDKLPPFAGNSAAAIKIRAMLWSTKGGAYSNLRMLPESIAAHKQSVMTFSQVPAADADMDLRTEHAIELGRLGLAEMLAVDRGEVNRPLLDSSSEHFTQSSDMLMQLLETEGRSPKLLHEYIRSLIANGDAQLLKGQSIDDAKRALDDYYLPALYEARVLAGEERDGFGFRRTLSVALERVSFASVRAGMPAPISILEESLNLAIELASFDPNDISLQEDLISSYRELGDAYMSGGPNERNLGIQYFLRALETAEDLKTGDVRILVRAELLRILKSAPRGSLNPGITSRLRSVAGAQGDNAIDTELQMELARLGPTRPPRPSNSQLPLRN